MSEKPESDEFEDEEPAEPVTGSEDVDLDQVTKDLDMAKKRGLKLGDPAWRRLERLREQKQTEELTRDLEDLDIGDEGSLSKKKRSRQSERLAAAHDSHNNALDKERLLFEIDPDRLEVRILGHQP